ncbi:LUC7-like protein [Akanthomyces lecanii RCEF 1005]|uniref:LUC7-like protein n=1 Tax=Akanthomyces lecanii RCEF 1005 TaxID=1081108 RepID=A0A168FL91_CORDF|nr:LUC7-like protein [Akanthomyces lecanii RCEF 1005]
MSNEEILTDDYVAGLLSQEASDCSIKYSALGVDAFLGKDSSSKKPANIPKPNTRFLRNIIKGTDTHNKALLAKEAAESKARLKRLERTEDIKRKKSNPSTKDIRERHMGDIQAILGGGKSRKRVDDNSTNKTELDGRDQDNAKRKSRAQKDRDYEKEADVTTGTIRDTRIIRPRMNTKLADTRVLETTDPNLHEVDIDLMEREAETQNVDATDIARRPETNRQGHMGSSLRYRTHSTMRLDRLLLHP